MIQVTPERPVGTEELGLRGQVLFVLILGRRRLMVDREHHVEGIAWTILCPVL